jgi:excisionase family DNA binding protein
MTAGLRLPDLDPISVRVPDAVRLTGLSRSRLYELMRSGEIEYVKVRGSTLFPYDGLRRFIERQRAAGAASDT